jgi:hypothetical protein
MKTNLLHTGFVKHSVEHVAAALNISVLKNQLNDTAIVTIPTAAKQDTPSKDMTLDTYSKQKHFYYSNQL